MIVSRDCYAIGRRYVVNFAMLVLAWVVLLPGFIEDCYAVPAFARKYDMTCNACHTRQPRLNAFGQRFSENGYQLPGTEDGGTTMKELFGGPLNGATLDDVTNYFAVRLRGEVRNAEFEEETEATDETDIDFPSVINLFFAGTVTRNISFFMEAEYSSAEEESGVGFERANLTFDNLGGHQIANLKIGELDPSAFFSFPTHRQQLNPIGPEAETDRFPPEINRIPVLPLAFSSKMFGLTTGPSQVDGEGFSILPFEPLFFNAPSQKAVQVHGRPFGPDFLYELGVAQNDTADDNPDTRWDPYVMLRYDILRGDYSALQVSGFYYRAPDAARGTLAPPPGDPVFSTNTLDWDRYGFGARWQYRSIDIYGTVIWDEIDKPEFAAAPLNTSDWDTSGLGASVEADWLFNRNWLFAVRYDYMDPGGLVKLPLALRTPGDPDINQTVSFLGLIAKYYPVPNVALFGRAHFNLEDSEQLPTNGFGGAENPGRNLESIYTIGVDMAF